MLDHVLTYRNYHIHYNRDCTPLLLDWCYGHVDYDGAPDSGDFRCARERTVEHCLLAIDELIENEENP
jgi:hypothetical protein